jgi:hypothetical protein
MEPINQLVSNVWESCKSLELIPLALDKVFLHGTACFWTMICNHLGPLGKSNTLKALPHQHEECFTVIMFVFRNSHEILTLKFRSMKARKFYGTKNAWT